MSKENKTVTKKDEFVVIHPFKDLQNKDKEYKIDDIFDSTYASEKRIKELLNSSNLLGVPLIKKR